ncbi:MAG: mercury resistance protein [Candidatus Methylomirabilis oxyfera]|nr:mercury resistance protein [Candidatus Methylomirabilis oxyfera]
MRHENPTPGGKGPIKGYSLLIMAALTCPCHLPVLLALTAGTVLGSALSRHLWLAGLLLTICFVGALYLGLKQINKEIVGHPDGL